MKNKPIFFAVCRYIPNILRGESINVGVVTHIPENNWVKFHKTKNVSRIRSFDDEVELEVMKALLDSLDYQFNVDHLYDYNELKHTNFLKKELVFFINQIQFSEVRVLNSSPEDLNKDINDIIDMYLYFDKKKSDRIDSNRVRSLASKMISQSHLKNSVDRQPKVKNKFNQLTFDFSLRKSGETSLIKALSFDYKKQNRFFNEIKSLLYDLRYFKDNDYKNLKIIINNTDINEDHEKLAYNSLKEVADIYTLEEFEKYIFFDNDEENYEQLNFLN